MHYFWVSGYHWSLCFLSTYDTCYVTFQCHLHFWWQRISRSLGIEIKLGNTFLFFFTYTLHSLPSPLPCCIATPSPSAWHDHRADEAWFHGNSNVLVSLEREIVIFGAPLISVILKYNSPESLSRPVLHAESVQEQLGLRRVIRMFCYIRLHPQGFQHASN